MDRIQRNAPNTKHPFEHLPDGVKAEDIKQHVVTGTTLFAITTMRLSFHQPPIEPDRIYRAEDGRYFVWILSDVEKLVYFDLLADNGISL